MLFYLFIHTKVSLIISWEPKKRCRSVHKHKRMISLQDKKKALKFTETGILAMYHFRVAVPFWGQTIQIIGINSLSPKMGLQSY